MNKASKYILGFVVCAASLYGVQQAYAQNVAPCEWPQYVHSQEFLFQRVTSERDASFLAICEMYALKEAELASDLEGMVCYCIYNAENQPIGAIQIDLYPTLESLLTQISDPAIAQPLFDEGKCFELSYALKEGHKGKGLGSKAVTSWINEARLHPWGEQLFAVVDEENIPSIKILEKNGLIYRGNYFHDQIKEDIRVYSFN